MTNKSIAAELEIVQLLNQRFGCGFSRSLAKPPVGYDSAFCPTPPPSSVKGRKARPPKIPLIDVRVPVGFRFVVAVAGSGTAAEVDVTACVASKSKELDTLLKYCDQLTANSGRPSLLIVRKTRQLPVVFLRADQAPLGLKPSLHYGEWVAVSFAKLLELPDSRFFERVSGDD